jgi:hypothetical protein
LHEARETTPPAVLSFHTPPIIRVIGPSTGVIIGSNAILSGAAGFLHESLLPVQVGGDWDNQSVRPDCFESFNGTIRMNGIAPQTYEAAATDLGARTIDATVDFVIGTLEMAAGSVVTLRDTFDNDLQGQASCGEAQYVDTLVLEAGATLTVQNCRLYYGSLVKDPTAQIIQVGCGEVRSAQNPEQPLVDPTGLSKSRTISFVPPSGANQYRDRQEAVLDVVTLPTPLASTRGTDGFSNFVGGAASAIRVTLTSLHHVDPPYNGGPSVPFTLFEGQVRWVGPPTQYIESNASPTPFHASSLQCTPHYQDWSTVGLLHVLGSAIVPSSSYRVQTVAGSCQGIEDRCTAISTALVANTTRWGDVETPYNPPSTTTQPDVGDIAALVKKFQSGSGAPIKARALLAGDDAFGNITTLNVDLGFGHIAACVDAFRGKPYPFAIQTCP